jgi:hypothetical protein
MKAKTLLLTSLLVAASGAVASAQVYSQNIVGYVNLTIPRGFTMIANALNTTNNTLRSIIPVAPPGTQFYKYTGSGYAISTMDEFDLTWDNNITLNPGEGGFIRNNDTASFTVTLVGEALTGTTTNSIPAGFSQRSSITPVATALREGGVPGEPGDQAYKFTNNGSGGGGYTISTFDEFDLQWDNNFTIGVGESIFIRKANSANWVRTFNVN